MLESYSREQNFEYGKCSFKDRGVGISPHVFQFVPCFLCYRWLVNLTFGHSIFSIYNAFPILE